MNESLDDVQKIVTRECCPNIVAVLTLSSIQIYDLSDIVKEDMMSDSFSLESKSSGQEEKEVKEVKPVLHCDLLTRSYDFVLDLQLDEEDYSNSWVSLVSKEFQLIHIVRFSELI